ncbi:Hypothetical protein LUCI_4404 [Lucifera butyrica]|uniref:Outer membrane protein beta-barrel domain-containing protein n=1 Tax=Lucifera butyrica TaxID=1351585 RepID=A0A498RJC4_9FIRM|nr:hypothetical protein [Lucifera butyrica]VBB09118.1 Hypothetical protein LUCI_4404 [Lucifera butyrica]
MLKKVLLILVVCLFAGTVSVFATPYNDLEEQGQTAAGILYGSDNNTYYIETKATDTVTMGFEYNDWKNSYGTRDFYGQFGMADNARAIVGIRNLDSETRTYLGAVLSAPITDECTGYVSGLIGDGFQEVQVGADYKLTEQTDFNLTYRNLNYHGNRGGLNFGLTFKM